MNARRPWRLSAMMALIYAVQGSFWPILAIHLAEVGVGGRDRGWIFATLAIASMAVPLGAGQLVDRLMATQHVLAAIYAAGTGLLVVLASGCVTTPGALFVVFLLYWTITAPAYGLSTALALRNLDDPGRQFGQVRAWGTAGWMIAGWVVSLAMWASRAIQSHQGAYEALWVAATFSGLASLFCLTLPHTPPLAIRRTGRGAIAACGEILDRPGVGVVLLTSFGVYLTLPLIYQVIPVHLEATGLPRAWVTAAMSLGQTTEIALLAVLPWMLGRFGVKRTLAIGIFAWLVRFGTLALGGPLWVATSGMLLHGAGIACFTVGAQLVIDSRAPGDLRASAQALLLVATSGVGSFLGNLLAGEAAARTHPSDVLVFLFPCIILGALLLYFMRGFRDSASGVPWAGAPNDEYLSRSPSERGAVARVGLLVTESADG